MSGSGARGGSGPVSRRLLPECHVSACVERVPMLGDSRVQRLPRLRQLVTSTSDAGSRGAHFVAVARTGASAPVTLVGGDVHGALQSVAVGEGDARRRPPRALGSDPLALPRLAALIEVGVRVHDAVVAVTLVDGLAPAPGGAEHHEAERAAVVVPMRAVGRLTLRPPSPRATPPRPPRAPWRCRASS